jgi:hypothetical protein
MAEHDDGGRSESTRTDSSPWDDVVWTMCSHLRKVPCRHCPRLENTGGYGSGQRLCRELAEAATGDNLAALRDAARADDTPCSADAEEWLDAQIANAQPAN